MEISKVPLEMITGEITEEDKKFGERVGTLYSTEVGKIIRYARKKNNISSSKLAEMLQISESELEKIENCSVIPNSELLKKMTGILKVNYSYLCISARCILIHDGYFNVKGEKIEVDQDVIDEILNDTEKLPYFSKIISENE